MTKHKKRFGMDMLVNDAELLRVLSLVINGVASALPPSRAVLVKDSYPFYAGPLFGSAGDTLTLATLKYKGGILLTVKLTMPSEEGDLEKRIKVDIDLGKGWSRANRLYEGIRAETNGRYAVSTLKRLA